MTHLGVHLEVRLTVAITIGPPTGSLKIPVRTTISFQMVSRGNPTFMETIFIGILRLSVFTGMNFGHSLL
jgi:hypothetical protein